MNFNKKKNTQITFLDYITVGYIIFITDTLLFSTNANTVVTTYARYSIVVVTIISILFAIRKKITIKLNNEIICFLIAIISIILTGFINFDFSRKLLSKILVLIFGFMISRKYSLEHFSYVFINILIVISLCSLALYFGINFIHKIPNFPTIKNVNGISYYTVFFSNIYRNWSGPILRTPGPFWEPGVFQLYLILGIIFLLIDNKRDLRKKIVILLIFSLNMILTFSTTGFIALVPLIASILFLSNNNINYKIKLLLVLILAIALIVVYNNEMLYNVLFNKIINTDNKSYDSRFNSLVDGATVFLKNPLLGVGPKELENTLLGYSIVNTVVMHFSVYGCFVGLYNMFGIYIFCKECCSNKMARYLIFVSILLSISGENFVYSLIMNTVIFLKKERNDIW